MRFRHEQRTLPGFHAIALCPFFPEKFPGNRIHQRSPDRTDTSHLTPLLAAHVRAQPATTTSASSANAPAVVAAPEKFRRPMPLLPEKKPVGRAGKSDVYVMTMKPARAEILPGLTTDVLTYDGHFP
ncbi:hypothetical protein GT038_22565, partial [Streptomyces sp. SID337]|nr:hypothetical protein [Streptomyces sp. SID337]